MKGFEKKISHPYQITQPPSEVKWFTNNPEMLEFCFSALFDWFKKFAPPSIRCKSQNQSGLDLVARACSRVFAWSSHWFVVLFTFVVIGQCDSFGFGFTTLDSKLLRSVDFPFKCAALSIWLVNIFVC